MKYYTLSVSKVALRAKIVMPDMGGTRIVGIVFTPDYGYMLRKVNGQSAVPLQPEAVANFMRLFLTTAHASGYDADRIYADLDIYVKDVRFLLDMGIQKVHQAFTLRESLIGWMETVRLFLGYAIGASVMPDQTR